MLNPIHEGEIAPTGKAAAILTVRDADKMTPDGRKRIAGWLRAQAKLILAEGDNYAPRFRGGYLCSNSGGV